MVIVPVPVDVSPLNATRKDSPVLTPLSSKSIPLKTRLVVDHTVADFTTDPQPLLLPQKKLRLLAFACGVNTPNASKQTAATAILLMVLTILSPPRIFPELHSPL